MGYNLTDADINGLFRRFSPFAMSDIGERDIVRDWFATLPVVALADVERALGPATDKDVEWFNAISVKGGINAVVARRRRLLDEPAPAAVGVEQVSSYMTYHPDRIEFRENGSGQHDPVVASISAGAFLEALTAISTAMKKGVDA